MITPRGNSRSLPLSLLDRDLHFLLLINSPSHHLCHRLGVTVEGARSIRKYYIPLEQINPGIVISFDQTPPKGLAVVKDDEIGIWLQLA